MSNDFFQFISVFMEKKEEVFYAVQRCGFEGLLLILFLGSTVNNKFFIFYGILLFSA